MQFPDTVALTDAVVAVLELIVGMDTLAVTVLVVNERSVPYWVPEALIA